MNPIKVPTIVLKVVNAELVRMVKCGNIQEDDLIYLPRKRLVEVANLLDA